MNGQQLKWVDEYAWIAAVRDYSGRRFVTVGMDRVEFHRSVREGTILRFDIRQGSKGVTSVCYEAKVFSEDPQSGQEESIFTTSITYVCLDDLGHKAPI